MKKQITVTTVPNPVSIKINLKRVKPVIKKIEEKISKGEFVLKAKEIGSLKLTDDEFDYIKRLYIEAGWWYEPLLIPYDEHKDYCQKEQERSLVLKTMEPTYISHFKLQKIKHMISVITATRRPENYQKMIADIESKIGNLITEYIGFSNNSSLKEQYIKIKSETPKLKMLFAEDDYIYRKGFNSLYNLLIKAAKGKYLLQIFDVDNIEVNAEEFKKDLELDKDLYGFKMYMQRGNVWENKYQLWKRDLVEWIGKIHENQKFFREPSTHELQSFKVIHNNAQDKESANLKRTVDGFIILERTEIGTDSDQRNMLYEPLAWKIANDEQEIHFNKGWFKKHYEINHEIVDWYAKRANEKYNLGWNI